MADFEYGPVEMLLIGFEGDRPGPAVVEAIGDLIEGGLVRLLDLTFVSRNELGEVSTIEIEDVSDEYGFGGVELEATGLAADEDIAEFAEAIPPGTSAALVVVELVWAKHLASKLAQSNGVVLASERIPAPIVNAALAEVTD
ncbi:DUF6325 family protein [Subtercola lobariae]|uniref:DUF1269 domain-containing protein n=1 Tax=Subtercola lobariae TaxID=1588641 RepID=A0A917B1Q7_9MICO|nr:DUF6325 family protein [Subtercola lobariae]GGF12173.1 hypothetical protein GCM10011399_02620 [Subtercola lobariae]